MNELARQEGPPSSEPVVKIDFKPNPSTVRIFLSFLGGTAIWAIAFMIVYGLNSLACVWNWFALPSGGTGPGLKVAQISISVIALALLAYCVYVAFREWRGERTQRENEEDESITARNSMLAFVSLLVNTLYFLITAVFLIPIFVLPVCFR
jgi:hypothetical protein